MALRRDVFHAIADPTRREILMLVAGEAKNLNSIADNFNVSRPAISQHIKILNECGLLQISQNGRERICELKPEKLKEIEAWIEPLKKLWEKRFESLDKLLDEMQS